MWKIRSRIRGASYQQIHWTWVECANAFRLWRYELQVLLYYIFRYFYKLPHILNHFYNFCDWEKIMFVYFLEILKIHSFVAQLPMSTSSSAQLLVKRLHSECMKKKGIDKSQADETLLQAMNSLCKYHICLWSSYWNLK